MIGLDVFRLKELEKLLITLEFKYISAILMWFRRLR